MLVLELAYMGELDFIKELQDLKTLLKEKNIVIGLVERIEGEFHIVKVMAEEAREKEEAFEKIKLYVSHMLYKFVIKNYKEKELFEFLWDTYFFLKGEDVIEAEKRIMETLNNKNSIKDEEDIYCQNKINGMVEKIKNCLEEENYLNINGFITFRMKALREDIEKVIDKTVQKYMVEKEYNEFIKLLKYFVDIQESKIEKIHIYINNDGNYILRDNDGLDLLKEFSKDLNGSKIGVDVNIEDVIISGLITNAPKEILIYHKELCTNREFLDTIEKVFVERVKFLEFSREIN